MEGEKEEKKKKNEKRGDERGEGRGRRRGREGEEEGADVLEEKPITLPSKRRSPKRHLINDITNGPEIGCE